MGLKQDLIDAKRKALEESLQESVEIDMGPGSFVEREAEYVKEAIVNFLTNCEFKITQLNAPVVLENFNIPPQEADITTGVQVDSGIMVTTGMGPGNTTTPGRLTNITPGTSDVLTKNIRVDKNGGETGILNSTGYVYIGRDPYTQSGFDVEDADGQREFTTVKLFREDIEDLL